jgi:hypothetical protein
MSLAVFQSLSESSGFKRMNRISSSSFIFAKSRGAIWTKVYILILYLVYKDYGWIVNSSSREYWSRKSYLKLGSRYVFV